MLVKADIISLSNIEKRVIILVNDLDAFIHAAPDDEVWVYIDDNDTPEVYSKKYLHNFSFKE